MLFREPLATCPSFLRLQDILANKPPSFRMIKRFLALRLVKFAQRSALGSAFTDEVGTTSLTCTLRVGHIRLGNVRFQWRAEQLRSIQ